MCPTSNITLLPWHQPGRFSNTSILQGWRAFSPISKASFDIFAAPLSFKISIAFLHYSSSIPWNRYVLIVKSVERLLINQINFWVLLFGFLENNWQLCIWPHDYWNVWLDDSGLFKSNLFSCWSQDPLMIECNWRYNWHFWKNHVCCVISTSQSDLNRCEITFLLFVIQKGSRR